MACVNAVGRVLVAARWSPGSVRRHVVAFRCDRRRLRARGDRRRLHAWGPEGGFKVALLNPGPISDAGWNASAYEGLLAVRDQLGAEISQVETRTPPEFEQAFRDYARRGFSLVIGHGFEFQDAAAKVAPDFPEDRLLTTSGNTVRPNVAPIVFRLEEATYLLGELAARMAPNGSASRRRRDGDPVGEEHLHRVPGRAARAKKDYPVTFSYLGNWDDVGARAPRRSR